MSDLYVIVGLGATGFSCARYLQSQGIPIAVTDTRDAPPYLAALKKAHPDVPVALGELDASLLQKASCIVVSPGVSLKEPILLAQIKRGVPVIGDIELFAKAIHSPLIAITGTNAKSTVTTIVGKMAEKAKLRVKVGGNLGTPALDLLTDSSLDLFVLELSSFQLETTYSLKPKVATVLNITPDHMDRYESITAYQKAKHRIYDHCEIAVCNRDDPFTLYSSSSSHQSFYFTLERPEANEFGLLMRNKETYLSYEDQTLLSVRELPISGKHDQANALAALAIGHGFGLPMDAMLNVLREFQGLPHRCQFVRERSLVKWYNDSKGTNVGATLAAILGLGSEMAGKLVLIAGGVGKNADFNLLLPAIVKYVRHVVLIGEAAPDIAKVIHQHTPYSFAATMEEAIQQADQQALPKDSVLLSPACASFDMFSHYEHRGDVFMEIVKRL